MDALIRPRDAVLQYGLLPGNILLPQLESVATLHGLVKGLAGAATTDSNGERTCTMSPSASGWSCSAVHVGLLLTSCRQLLHLVAIAEYLSGERNYSDALPCSLVLQVS
jgi:hypothetical protein